MKASRAGLSVLIGATAALIFAASFAFACSPSRSVSLSAEAAEPGDIVTVTGTAFYPGEIVVRWGGPTGDMIAKITAGGSFITRIRVPQVAPGPSYTIYVVGPDQNGQTTGATVATARIAVTPDTNPTQRPVEEPAVTEPVTTPPATEEPATTPPATEEPRAAATAAAETDTSTSPATPDAASAVGESTPAAGSSRTPGAAVAPVRDRFSTPADAPPAGAPQARPAEAAATTPGAATGPAPAAPTAQPSTRSAIADLWSGVQSSDLSRGPSLDRAEPARSNVPVAIGVALLTIGLLVLAAGAALVETRRRRVRASS